MTDDHDPPRSFLDTGLDWSSEGFTEDERAKMVAWYEANHESGNSHLSKFPRFWIEHDPGGFKRYRRYMIEIDQPREGSVLPQAAHLLMYLYLYTVFGNEKGILYLVINARAMGARRTEVIDTFRIAALAGGPFGINAAAELADEYLREWTEPDTGPGIPWPDGWKPDRAAFRSGIDHGSNDLPQSELELLREWYRSMYGDVPSHVDLLARLHPRALKTQRIKVEAAVGDALPAQMVALCQLLLAAVRLWQRPLLRAAALAKSLGVTRHQVVETIFWAGVYADEAVLEHATDVLGPMLEAW